MRNYISLERIWQDYDFFQLKVCCASDVIEATTEVYTSDKHINDLSKNLKKFLNENTNEFTWESGKKGDDFTACISLRFTRKDKLGHILVETYMELEDGGNFSQHNCCFYVETELGLLFEFDKGLHRLLEPRLGQKIVLNNVM